MLKRILGATLGLVLGTALVFAQPIPQQPTSEQFWTYLESTGPTMLIRPGHDTQLDQDEQTVLDASNLTMWLDPNANVTTVDGKVSQWDASDTSGISFTQGTAADRPILSRADNKENRIPDSSDLSTWTATGVSVASISTTAPDGSTITAWEVTEDSSTGEHRIVSASVLSLNGEEDVFKFYVKRGTGTRDIWPELKDGWPNPTRGIVDLDDGTDSSTVNCTIDATDSGNGWYYVTVTATGSSTITAATLRLNLNSAGANSYTGDGSSSLIFYQPQLTDSSLDSDYVETDGTPAYPGINGNKGLVFLGGQALSSTTTVDTLINNDSYTKYFVIKKFDTATGYVQWDGGYSYFDSFGGNHRNVNNDSGGADTALQAVVANQLEIFKLRHDTGNITISSDSGSGFGSETSSASGNTTNLTGTLFLGSYNATGSGGFNGYILDIITADASSQADVEAYLQAKYFNVVNPRVNQIDSTVVSLDENMYTYSDSNESGGWGGTRVNLSYASDTNPFGVTSNVTTLTEQVDVNTSHAIYMNSSSGVSSGVSYRFSAWVKSSNRHASIRTNMAGTGFALGYAHFNLTTGAKTSSSGIITDYDIEDWGNGWFRIWAEMPANASSSGANIAILPAETPADAFYDGDGSTMQVYGMQLQRSTMNPRYVSTGATSIAGIYPAVSFVQSTDSAKPLLTESGPYENLNPYSEDLDNAQYSATNMTVDSSNIATEASDVNQYHYFGWASYGIPFASGETIRWIAKVKGVGDRDIGIRTSASAGMTAGFGYFDLGDCSTGSSSGNVTNLQARQEGTYCVVSLEETATAAGSTGFTFYITKTVNDLQYDGDGSSGLDFEYVQVQRASMNPTYIPTNALPRHGSLTGQRGLYFDGSNDGMTSTSTFDDIANASAKTFLTVGVVDADATVIYVGESTRYYEFYNSSDNKIYVNHSDGTTDSVSVNYSVGDIFIQATTHDGTNLTTRVISNGSKGTSTVASGSTAAMNNTLILGAGSGGNYLQGQILLSTAWDKVFTEHELQELIKKTAKEFNLDY